MGRRLKLRDESHIRWVLCRSRKSWTSIARVSPSFLIFVATQHAQCAEICVVKKQNNTCAIGKERVHVSHFIKSHCSTPLFDSWISVHAGTQKNNTESMSAEYTISIRPDFRRVLCGIRELFFVLILNNSFCMCRLCFFLRHHIIQMPDLVFCFLLLANVMIWITSFSCFSVVAAPSISFDEWFVKFEVRLKSLHRRTVFKNYSIRVSERIFH